MLESIQHKLDRVRSPRVHITYDVEIGDAIEVRELPFVMGVMADLSGASLIPLPRLKDRKFVEMDGENFMDVMASVAPRVDLTVANKITGNGNLKADLVFSSVYEFDPLSIVRKMPALSEIYDARVRLNDLLGKMDGNEDLVNAVCALMADKKALDDVANDKDHKADGAISKVVEAAKMVKDDSQREYAGMLIAEFASQVASKSPEGDHAAAFIQSAIADIDGLLAAQMDEILHHPDFQRMEAAWRGLHFLVLNSETGTRLKIRVLNITKSELLKDLERATDFDQSNMFKKIYEEEYGTFGGAPFSCLVADFEFGRHPQDILLLEKMSNVAAAAHAPFISAASSLMFDMESYMELGIPRDMAKLFENTELARWNTFRMSEDSRYVSLVLPHVLMRLPYGPKTLPVEGMNYTENVDGQDNSKFCWGNAAYALAQRITNAFAMYGWTAAIRGVEGGGLVTGLPAYTFKTPDGDSVLKCPTEIAITDRREKELSDLGFIALLHAKGTDRAAFFGAQTTQAPKMYDLDTATANANLSARLTYLLAASRFAHYIKVIMRDKIGSFMSRQEVQAYLQRWISRYVLLTDSAQQSVKARYPLREARVDVFEVPGRPGSYKATVFLRPHFQMEELTVSLRLVAQLPPPAR